MSDASPLLPPAPDPRATPPVAAVGPVAAIVGRIGVWFITFLIAVLGRKRRLSEVPWLNGPVGGTMIGDSPYQEVADAEGLSVERHARDGGLVPDFTALNGPGFDAAKVHAAVRAFYENTPGFQMDVWSRSYFPGSIGLWLLVTTISRQVNQLNFPLSPLDTASGITSEIILLRRADRSLRYTGWFRTLTREQRVLYTGFYMTERPPGEARPCVKVVFPMPSGNATVLLRPEILPDGSFTLDSSGQRFGDAGFYRVVKLGADELQVWHVKTLRERFHLFVDASQVLRCDHTVHFLGLPVLTLHYKIVPVAH